MSDASREAGKRDRVLAPGAVFLFAATLAIYFHDRFWWPPDDGAYAYVATRILAGDTLNGTIQDLHAGYVNLWHAATLWLFGEDIASLRYPLAALTVGAALLAYRLLMPEGRDLAVAGGVAMTAFFFLPFLNPTANWYALFLTLAIVAVLAEWPAARPGRWEAVGFLLATLFLFRQLSGVIVAMGVVAYAIATIEGSGRRGLARSLAALLAAGLCLYLWQKGSVTGLLLIGLWPLLLLVRIVQTTDAGNGETAHAMGRLVVGGLLGLVPMVLFHTMQGTLASWIEDTVLTAFRLTELDFIGEASYATIGGLAIVELVSGAVVPTINAIHWLLLLVLPMLVGLAALLRWPRRPEARHPLIVVAPFFAVVALHYQIPIYLTYTSGLSWLALLWVAGTAAPGWRRAAIASAGAVAAVAIVWQTAQPVTRGLSGIVEGETRMLGAAGLPRASVRMEDADIEIYSRLLALIERHAAKDATILALPMNPEIYFLSDRRAPVRFFASALGLRTAEDVARTLAEIETAPPALVIHRPDDKYNTASSDALLGALRTRYEFLESVDGFDLYIPRDR